MELLVGGASSWTPRSLRANSGARSFVESERTEDSLGSWEASSPRLQEVEDFEYPRLMPLCESVYDWGLMGPIIHGKFEPGRWFPYKRRYFCTTVLLLFLNFVMQYSILAKVWFLSDAQEKQMVKTLFETCVRVRDSETVMFKKLLNGTPANEMYWDCNPLSVTVSSTVSHLDLNGDGFWTRDEALEINQRLNSKLPLDDASSGREADMQSVFIHVASGRNGNRIQAHKVLHGESGTVSYDGVRLPVSWLKLQEPMLDLCVAGDPRICGNFEVRGVLESKLVNETDPDTRIAICEETIEKTCPFVFGERFRLNAYRGEELCGAPTYRWSPSKQAREVIFGQSDKFVNTRDGIEHFQYVSFLWVIVMIWFMLMGQELRKITAWWMILLLLPEARHSDRGDDDGNAAECQSEFSLVDEVMADDGENQESVKTHIWGEVRTVGNDEQDQHEVKRLPASLRWFSILFNVLPRTAIAVTVAFVGCNFLVRADDYMELILNSVALGFLIEIDEMLFHAVVAEEDKLKLRDFKDIELKAQDVADRPCVLAVFRRLDAFRKWLPTAIVYTALMFTISIGMIASSYFGDRGKMSIGNALNCLCQVSGRDCVGAQLLGGSMAHLPDFQERPYHVPFI